MAKLATVLGIDLEDVLDVELGPAPPATLATLRAAVASKRQVEIDYYGYGRDAHTTRIVEPALVYSAAGQWYVAAYCHLATDRRLFRVDRIEGARLLDTPFAVAPVASPTTVYAPGPDDPRIVLDLTAAASWVPGQYPVEADPPLGEGPTPVALRASGRPSLAPPLLPPPPAPHIAAHTGP